MPKPDLKVLDGGGPKPTPRARATRSAATRAKTLAQAIATKDKPAELRAIQVILGRRIADPKTSAVAVAALTKQFRELGDQIAALDHQDDPEAEGSHSSGQVPDAEWNDDDI